MAGLANRAAFAPALHDWWEVSGRRDLPWQGNPNRYRVWVSEIMLQQTQVATVERYYDRFMAAFPTITALAAAPADRVMHLWSGLGYYARARNLQRAARIVVSEFGGELPGDAEALQSLPGIGRSTAGAILSLADDRRHPILDGNAKRVYARVFGIEGWPGRSGVLRELWAAAEACTPAAGAARYTQAIMDLGATVCLRRRPLCEACPLGARCTARRTGRTADIPGAKPKRAKPRRAAVLVLARRPDGAFLLQRRPDRGISGGLWCFPETDAVERVGEWCHATLGRIPERTCVRPLVQHSFTHFDFDMTPVEAHVAMPPERVMDGGRWLWYNPREPARVGLAAPVARLLEAFGELQ